MKRALAALLLIGLLLSAFAGCKTAEPVVTAIQTPKATQAPSPVPTAAPTPTPEPTQEPRAFERGVWMDAVYESDYLHLRFVMPEGFIAATDEEMASFMEIGAEALDDINELQAKIASLKTIYDMMASSPTTGANTLVMLENLSMTIGGSGMRAEDYAAVVTQQLTGMEVAGFTYSVGEGYEATLSGETYYVLPTTFGDGLMEQDYYLRRVDNYMLVVCFSGVSGSEEMAIMKDAYQDMAPVAPA